MSGTTTQSGDVALRDDRRDWLAGSWSRRDVLVAVVLGLLVVLLAWIYRSAVVPTDPWRYVWSARNFPTKGWVPLGYTRYGIVLTLLPLLKAFHNSEIVYYFWPLLSAGVLTFSVYLIGRRWWGPVAGLVAVVLLISNTVIFYNLSRGYPDIMSMALFCLAVVLALHARDRILAGGSALWWLLGVGFLLGWGFEVRETSLLAWPVVAVILWQRRALLRTVVLVALPILFWAGVDIGVSAVAYGDPLLKYHTLSGQDIAAVTNPADIAANSRFIGKPRTFYLTIIPRSVSHAAGGIWMLVLAGITLLALLLRNGAARLMACWFIGIYALSVLFGGFLNPAAPGARLDVNRYWIPFLPPIALATAAVVAVVGAFIGRRVVPRLGRSPRTAWSMGVVGLLALAVCAGPVVSGVRFATSEPGFAPNGGAALEGLRAHLAAQPFHDKTIWTDWETARILPVYQRGPLGQGPLWTGKVKSLTGTDAEPQPGDYVLLNSAHSEACSFCRDALAPWLKDHRKLPATWVRAYASGERNLTLYRVE